MKLDRITLTGADDTITAGQLDVAIGRHPEVEWGLLVSDRAEEGLHRFPSYRKLEAFLAALPDDRFAIHVCGKWVRDICGGDWGFLRKIPIADRSCRIQLNFHCYSHLMTDEFFHSAKDIGKQLIFQVDGKNDHLVAEAIEHGIDAVPLFDKSGGRGVVPDRWPDPLEGIYSGYAGGLGPSNLDEEVRTISEKGGDRFWIDMETSLYTGTQFDLDLCTQCVESIDLGG